jgi:oxygen-independent coproporphyrinogen-3 oxidase
VAKVTFWAREIGYTSISHDLIYGLPFQTLEDVVDTIEKTKLSLKNFIFLVYNYINYILFENNNFNTFALESVMRSPMLCI